MKVLTILTAWACLLVTTVYAQPKKGYAIGDEVAGFTLKNVDGKMVSLSGFKNARGFVVVFTGNKCPFARLYEERLNNLHKHYAAEGIRVLAINANNAALAPEDSYEQMVIHAKQKKLAYPYLYDETQQVARAFGATKTPQAFVLYREQNKWILRYSGAIDDNGAQPEKARHHYLEDALEALLHNQPLAVTNTRCVGCSIKWKE